MPFLVVPSEVYKDTFLKGLEELHAEGRALDLQIEALSRDFGGFVRSLLEAADRSKLKPGRVPESIYWLIDDEGNFIGTISIRHELNENLSKIGGHIGYGIIPSQRRRGYGKLILGLALEKARELGLRKVLITCDPGNVASRKIIEHNGGVLENEIEAELDGEKVRRLRFWIKLCDHDV